jgi:hypothetical protein
MSRIAPPRGSAGSYRGKCLELDWASYHHTEMPFGLRLLQLPVALGPSREIGCSERRFAMQDAEAWPILLEYNARLPSAVDRTQVAAQTRRNKTGVASSRYGIPPGRFQEKSSHACANSRPHNFAGTANRSRRQETGCQLS